MKIVVAIVVLFCYASAVYGQEVSGSNLHASPEKHMAFLERFVKPNGEDLSLVTANLLPVSLVFTVILGLLFLVGFIFGVQLAHQKMLHVTYQLWIVSLLLHTTGMLILACGWLMLAYGGIRREEAELTGHISKSVGTVIFALILVLMSKGYTITKLTMRDVEKMTLVFLMTGFAISHVALFIIQRYSDPRSLTNIYNMSAFLGLILIRTIATAWSLYGISCTIKDNPDKRPFCTILAIFISAWFLGEPLVAFISTFCLPLYCRAKLVFGLDVGIMTIGHLIFIFVMRPSSRNVYFPFNMKTNKDIEKNEADESAVTNDDVFLTIEMEDGMVELPTITIPLDEMVSCPAVESAKKLSVKCPQTIPLDEMVSCPAVEPAKKLSVKCPQSLTISLDEMVSCPAVESAKKLSVKCPQTIPLDEMVSCPAVEPAKNMSVKCPQSLTVPLDEMVSCPAVETAKKLSVKCSQSLTVPLDEMVTCPAVEPTNKLPVKCPQNEIVYTDVEDITMQTSWPFLQPSYRSYQEGDMAYTHPVYDMDYTHPVYDMDYTHPVYDMAYTHHVEGKIKNKKKKKKKNPIKKARKVLCLM